MKGAEAKTTPDINKNFLLPKMSEREAAGKLINIPGMVEAEATKPIQKPSGVSRLVANGFKTGFLDIVELRIANNPIMQRVQKILSLAFFACETINKPT
jgi:hypothetical protein